MWWYHRSLRTLSFCPFSFGHCVVCPSIHIFWLPLCYLQTCLAKVIILWIFQITRQRNTNCRSRCHSLTNKRISSKIQKLCIASLGDTFCSGVMVSKIGHGYLCLRGFMVRKATFNNISVISWRSVLLVEESGIPGM